MDESETMDPEIIKGLFDQGLMGIETSAEHGGSEMSFMAAVIAVEGEPNEPLFVPIYGVSKAGESMG